MKDRLLLERGGIVLAESDNHAFPVGFSVNIGERLLLEDDHDEQTIPISDISNISFKEILRENKLVMEQSEDTRDIIEGFTGTSCSRGSLVTCGAIGEKTGSINDGCVGSSILQLCRTAECADGVGESINGIGVVEWLCTKGCVEDLTSDERVTVADVGVRLDNPDKFFAWVVEVKFNFVG